MASLADTRILLVDDDPDVAYKFKTELEKAEFANVRLAHSPTDALQELRDLRADVVFMDVKMPDSTDVSGTAEYGGVSAARVIRELYGIPVVYLSAFNDREILSHVKRVDPEVSAYTLKAWATASDLKIDVEIAIHRQQIANGRPSSFSFSCDDNLSITACSQEMGMLLFATDATKLLGRNIAESAPDSFRDAVLDVARQVLNGRGPVEYSMLTSGDGIGIQGTLAITASPIALGSEVIGVRHQLGQNPIRECDTTERLRNYQRLFGEDINLTCRAEFVGRVRHESHPEIEDAAIIELEREGKRLVRVIPKDRLEAIRAAFPDASIKYEIFSLGGASVSKLSYIGHSTDELLKDDPEPLRGLDFNLLIEKGSIGDG